MTLPVSGNSISLSQVNTELGRAASNALSMNDASLRSLFQAGGSGTIVSMSQGLGKGIGYVLLTTGSGSYTLPVTNTAIRVYCIGGGGSGGGGTGRTANTGPYTGGGGGGSGGCTYTTYTLSSQTVYYNIGAGGAAVGGRDGGYSGAVPGNAGGTTWISQNSGNVNPILSATGGGGGGSSVYAGLTTGTGGGSGGGGSGTIAIASTSGGNSYYPTQSLYTSAYNSYLQANGGGGYGGGGYNISGISVSKASNALGGVGNDIGRILTDSYGYPYLASNNYTWVAGYSLRDAAGGTGYGGGGGGGGKDNEYWGGGYTTGAAGSGGAILIIWGQ